MSTHPPAPRVAILHDYLTQYGGAEHVLEVLGSMWPGADLYTTFYDHARMTRLGFHVSNPVRTLFPDWMPHKGHYAKLWTFVYPVAWRLLNLGRYDLIISSTSFAAHHARARGATPHISYCHSPARFLYGLTTELDHAKIRRRFPFAGLMYGVLRSLDREAAKRVTVFVANSREVQERIARIYGRPAEVIYPPVDVEPFAVVQPVQGEYFLTWGRLVASKRVDLIVQAAALAGVPLVVAGTGPDEARLRRLAAGSVRFVGRVSDTERSALLARCRAVLFAAEEDFGLVPVEAMAAGKPVIAYGGGGALETVLAGETGEFFVPATPEALARVIAVWRDDRYSPERCRARAMEFDAALFQERMRDLVANCLSQTIASRSAIR